ncbi:cell division protein FtsQ/DivIB [Rothia nasimurium]|uniref:cell division protein FtsQ/DivIB n=1 Tax=Rothia nasimurium TaxID=85336 RepID=UPI001F2BCD57|nr:cell division protein FtsQ/DivIB [Rothia nasimurium]
MAEENHAGEPVQRKKPKVRLNSSKVSQLDSREDNLVDIRANSRFAQWQQAHAAAEDVDADASARVENAPIPLRPRRGSAWKKIGYASLGALLFVALFVGVVFYSPLLATRTITVEGAHLLDQPSLEKELRQLEGIPLTRITESDVAQIVGNEELLYGISLEAHPPHDLVVKLHERVPVAVVEQDGKYVLVDHDGAILGRASSPEAAGVPLVAGGMDIVQTTAFATVTGVLTHLPGSILSQVAKAEASSASSIALTMADGTKVIWGTPDQSDLKAKVLVQLMDSVGSQQAVETYDVSSPLVPTVK